MPNETERVLFSERQSVWACQIAIRHCRAAKPCRGEACGQFEICVRRRPALDVAGLSEIGRLKTGYRRGGVVMVVSWPTGLANRPYTALSPQSPSLIARRSSPL